MLTIDPIPSPPKELPILLQCLQSALEETKASKVLQSGDLRKEALNLAKKLVAGLEQPEEVVMRWGFEVGDCPIDGKAHESPRTNQKSSWVLSKHAYVWVLTFNYSIFW